VEDYRCGSTHGAIRCQLVAHQLPELPHAHFNRRTMICTRWDESGSWLEPRGPFGDVTAERVAVALDGLPGLNDAVGDLPSARIDPPITFSERCMPGAVRG
jgi:hypothetical protein